MKWKGEEGGDERPKEGGENQGEGMRGMEG